MENALTLNCAVKPSEHLPDVLNPKHALCINDLAEWFNDRDARKSDILALANVTAQHAMGISYFGMGPSNSVAFLAASLPFSSAMFASPDKAIKNLDACMWARVMSRGDLLDAMTSVKKAEWNKKLETRTFPEFTKDNVLPTLRILIEEQGLYFAERVDAVFHALSSDHVTNSPAAFGKRMIINEAIEDRRGLYDTVSKKIAPIDDLRVVTAIMLGRASVKISQSNTVKIIDNLINEKRFGEWVSMDGNSLRIKIFKVGTVHLEVHPDMVYKLNDVLAMLYPTSIPESFRRPSGKKGFKEFKVPVETRLFSLSALQSLLNVRKLYLRSSVDLHYLRRLFPEHEVLYEVFETETSDPEGVKTALSFIGGVEVTPTYWAFDYNPMSAIQQIVRFGALPDKEAFQFFPSKGDIGEQAAMTLRAHLEDCSGNLLEPSIGQAELAQYIPEGVWTGVELSDVNSAVSRAKGFHVETADFITWAKECNTEFDGVLMNPPYCDYQASTHTLAAYGLLKQHGVLVAILPEGYQLTHLEINLPKGARMDKGDVIHGAFKDTNVSVRIVTLFKDDL
jgi:hypothetical protein